MGHKQGVNRKNPYAYEAEKYAKSFFEAETVKQDTGHRNDGRLKSGVLFEIKTTNNPKDEDNAFWGAEYSSHLKHNEDFILLIQKVETDKNRNLTKISKAEAYKIDHNIWKQHFKQEAVDYFKKLKEEWISSGKHPDKNKSYDGEWKECQEYIKEKWNTEYITMIPKKSHNDPQFRLQCSINKAFLNQFQKLEEIDGKKLDEYIGPIDFTRL